MQNTDQNFILREKFLNEPVLKIIVPCYNESEVLEETAEKLKGLLVRMVQQKAIAPASRIIFVNDGSVDDTWEKVKFLADTDSCYGGLNLSKNFGHQAALIAGLQSVDADIYVTIDADLQDDPEKIIEMVQQYKDGCDIVLGVRSSREKDSFFKRNTAVLFYKLLKFIGTNTVENHADYRLMSRRAVEAFSSFPERNLFLRGIVTLLGYKQGKVYYARAERVKGETKYPFRKMVALAIDGVTSFSIVPLRLAVVSGVLMLLGSGILFGYTLVVYLVEKTIRGWSSLIATILLIGSIQTFILVIIGEYIGKIYIESKQRPIFILEDKIEK